MDGFLKSKLSPAANPHAVVYKVDGSEIFVTGKERKWLHPIKLKTQETVINLSRPIYVGENEKEQYNLFITNLEDVKPDYLASGSWVNARVLFNYLDENELSLLSPSMSMYHWLTSFKFCPQCGGTNQLCDLGAYLRCSSCSAVHYPQITPAIIVAVLDGRGNVLLSQRRKQFIKEPGNKPILTILAGHVSQGESLEDAVSREVFEESNVVISKLRYAGSQPWPFPSQLMGCFYAVADNSPILKADQDELLSVAWVSKESVLKAIRGSHEFALPPVFTATYNLLSFWAEGKVDDMGFPNTKLS
ncbi:unnamed protein product [Phytomonas sp. Hart1]|nr:unnamed protein product [Phytomonas sp. Hart1]|eukprot:CCW71416.1 unnamed protein product [Phytomonas sp. isolate Hart1]